jgi:hypothetical protein
MSTYAAFRRQSVPQQYAQNLQTVTLPAPTRGIIQSENDAYMQPGGAVVQDNWVSTLRGVKLRGGTVLYCDLHAGGGEGWDTGKWDIAQWDADPAAPVAVAREPVVSMFSYVNGDNMHRMFAGQRTKLFDVTLPLAVPVKSGQTSGNYAATQLANLSGEHLIVVNDAGDPVLHFDGAIWETFDADQLTAPAGSGPEYGRGLTYVWAYRGRLFFIEGGTMNAWFLNVDEYQGALQMIPLGGSAAKGGSLLFGATWSVDTGDGVDDKCVFCTTQGELIIFSGGNPGDPADWAQQGRYAIGRPMGMNGHMLIGGDLLIMTVDGIVPTSQAIAKDSGTLDLAMVTNTIRPMWRSEVSLKSDLPWTMIRWDSFGGIFVTWPGGLPGAQYCAVMNNATTAWSRLPGYDARAFALMYDDLYYGSSDGRIIQCERGGTDLGAPYVATLVGGWEMFQAPSSETVWHQARAVFAARSGQPFVPQLNATVDYLVTIPPPPPAGPDPGVQDVWDQGLWDVARWDQPAAARPPIRNTMWVSIGKTGFAHAPVVQVTVAQQAPPDVELLALSATYERAGVNV